MDLLHLLNLFMRWLHVSAAVAGVGATLFVRFVLLPALPSLPNGAEVLERLRPGLKRLIHSALGLVILTGMYNYTVVAMPRVREAREAGKAAFAAYHPLMGLKMLLSFALLGIAIALLKPVPSFHEKRGKWLTVNSVIGLVILLIAAYLRRLW